MTLIHPANVLLCATVASLLIGSANLLAAQGASGPGAKATDEYTAALPKDVYPDSGNRLPLIKRQDLSEQDRKVFDLVAGDTRSLVGLRGPGGIRLYSPRLSEAAFRGNEYLRFENGLDRRLSELAILVTARELDQQFEWTAHEPAGLKAGLEQSTIDVVKYRKALTGLGEKEAAIIQLGREAVGKRKVSPETFARTLKEFGKEGVVNLVSLMGQYSATSILLNTFDQQLPPGQKPLLPIP
jgi:4-carboxymuconolactone decarboxylase